MVITWNYIDFCFEPDVQRSPSSFWHIFRNLSASSKRMGVPQSVGVLRCHTHKSLLFQGNPTPPTATSACIPELISDKRNHTSEPGIGSISRWSLLISNLECPKVYYLPPSAPIISEVKPGQAPTAPTAQRLKSVPPGMYVAFVSHQWLGKSHCDSLGHHSCTLREMLRELLQNKLRIEPLGLGWDGLPMAKGLPSKSGHHLRCLRSPPMFGRWLSRFEVWRRRLWTLGSS